MYPFTSEGLVLAAGSIYHLSPVPLASLPPAAGLGVGLEVLGHPDCVDEQVPVDERKVRRRDGKPIGADHSMGNLGNLTVHAPVAVNVMPAPQTPVRAHQVPLGNVVAKRIPQEPLRSGAEELGRVATKCELQHL